MIDNLAPRSLSTVTIDWRWNCRWHAPINKFEDMLEDKQANAADTFAEVEGVRHKLIKQPVRLSSQAGIDGPVGPAPPLGANTQAVLSRLGYSAAEIEAFAKKGVT